MVENKLSGLKWSLFWIKSPVMRFLSLCDTDVSAYRILSYSALTTGEFPMTPISPATGETSHHISSWLQPSATLTTVTNSRLCLDWSTMISASRENTRINLSCSARSGMESPIWCSLMFPKNWWMFLMLGMGHVIHTTHGLVSAYHKHIVPWCLGIRPFYETAGLRSVQRTFCFLFCLQQQTVCALNDHCSANGHVSVIYSNSSLIVHSLSDIG